MKVDLRECRPYLKILFTQTKHLQYTERSYLERTHVLLTELDLKGRAVRRNNNLFLDSDWTVAIR